MLNLSSILVFSDNPEALTEFYKNVFQKDPDWTGGDFSGFSVGNGSIAIGPHQNVSGKNIQPERLIFNLESDDVKSEFERIKNTGAKVIKELYQPEEEPSMWIATLADPDNNYFQIVTPMGS